MLQLLQVVKMQTCSWWDHPSAPPSWSWEQAQGKTFLAPRVTPQQNMAAQRQQGNAEPRRWGHFETRSSLKGEVTLSQPLLDRDHFLTTPSSREVATSPTRTPVNMHGLHGHRPGAGPSAAWPRCSWGRAALVASKSSSKCHHLLPLSHLLTKAAAFDLGYTS